MYSYYRMNIAPEKYIMPFGKYKGMYAADVAQIYVVDKDGNDKATGLMYLEWICKQDWFKHKEIIEKVISNAEQQGNVSEEEQEEEPAQKKKDKKSNKKSTVKISTDVDSKTLEFQYIFIGVLNNET